MSYKSCHCYGIGEPAAFQETFNVRIEELGEDQLVNTKQQSGCDEKSEDAQRKWCQQEI